MLGGAAIKELTAVEEIAALVIYLCGPSSRHITGTSIPIDGAGSPDEGEDLMEPITRRRRHGVGARERRREDERHLAGRGTFVADLRLPGLASRLVQSTRSRPSTDRTVVVARSRLASASCASRAVTEKRLARPRGSCRGTGRALRRRTSGQDVVTFARTPVAQA
ncbi:hypothetical protein ACQPZQ_16025 [Pseudonocardia sp. CA-142604]|uniref:hypothetical protein n=1 Tax=Pseudonocardia sp. CA-142604 TaxID=3240024 RepID=UPI003D94347E